MGKENLRKRIQDGEVEKCCAASSCYHIKITIKLYNNQPGKPPEV